MASAYLQIQLSVQPQKHGEAVLVPPLVLKDVNYSFVIVKEGGTEAVVKVEEPDARLKQVEKDQYCKKLTAKQLETLQASYSKPKIKRKYRAQPQSETTEATKTAPGLFAVDQIGNKIVDTFQTVRSGFYLIDVPILIESLGKT